MNHQKGPLSKKDIRFFKRMIILILFLVISLSYLYIGKSVSYKRYERISFQSSGVTLYANLYYPSNEIVFQEKCPLIIYCHGIGSQRDFDLRIPIEFSKRGFYIATLDYQGHGESGGNLNYINPSNNIPALAQDCSYLLDKLETMSFYNSVNTSQIGLIGHSLGGMVVLMNQALDPRFNVTVAWAPLVNFDPQEKGIFNTAQFYPYIPVNLINTTNTHNLLIIMHINDEALNFSSQALVAQNLTGCSVIPITEPLIGGGHQLFTDRVIIESINWFEGYFFNSETINGPINITFLLNYVAIFISLGLLVLIILNLISYTSNFFVYKQDSKKIVELSFKDHISIPRKFKEIFKIFIYASLFFLNWEIFERIFGFLGIFFASLNITIIYLSFLLARYLKRLRNKQIKFGWNEIKILLKYQFKLRYLLYVLLCNFYFVTIYFIFSISYPFAFIWPSNFFYSIIMAEVAFPVYFSMELLFRKVIYPQLYFLKNERRKTFWLLLIIIYVHFNLISATWTWSFFPSVICMYFILLYTSIQNTIIYENTQRFSTVMLSSFIIVQLFFAAVISNVLGIGSALQLFIR